jgi:hypothetical protein
MRGLAIAAVVLGGCYTGARATRDVNAAWRGHARAQLERQWGKPARFEPSVAAGDTEGRAGAFIWSHSRREIAELPSGNASLEVDPTGFDARGELRLGSVVTRTTEVAVQFDDGGRIVAVDGPSLRWGPPRGTNLRWGTIFGAHIGMGRLADTGTPLPSGGVYIGGMLGPRLGLVGVYSFVAGTGNDGGAIGMNGGIAVQYWPLARLAVRAGPAMVLAWDAGFDNGRFRPGVNASVAYAFLRQRVFALDVRFDVTGASETLFGSLGVGVNVE